MTITESPLPGLLIIEPKVFEDSRGYFFESFNRKNLMDAGIGVQFVQDNQSLSQFGVLRGLHYQLAPYSQSKLVRVLQGSVWDVAVDIRKKSPTFGHFFGIELRDSGGASDALGVSRGEKVPDVARGFCLAKRG